MRQSFVLLLVALCVMTTSRSAVAKSTSHARPDRPVVRKVTPLSLRYRQQISQQIHLPNQQPNDTVSAVFTNVFPSGPSARGEAVLLPGDAGLFHLLTPLRM